MALNGESFSDSITLSLAKDGQEILIRHLEWGRAVIRCSSFMATTVDASGISIDVKMPKATFPWACRTDRQGKVQDVHFKGSEGAH